MKTWIDELFVPRPRPRQPQAQATRGKPDARSAGMDRLSNGQVVREPGFSRRKIRAMRRDWGAKLRKRAKLELHTRRSSGGVR